MRRILYFADASSIHTVRWVNAIADRGLDVHLLSLNPASPDLKAAVTLHHPPLRRKIGYIANRGWARRLVTRLIPDVVHAHYASGYGALAMLVGFKPTIVSVWGADVYDFPRTSPLHRLLVQLVLTRANRLLSTSETMARHVKSLVQREVIVTPFGVDLRTFAPAPTPSEEAGAIVIGTVKSLEIKYGIDYLIRAFHLLTQRLPHLPLRLVVVGSGSQERTLKNLARDLGVGQLVRFVGHICHAQVPQYLNTFDISVAPSIFDSESFGVAVIEASACGRPVVVSDVGGLPEVVEKGVTGLVVSRKNAAELAEALEHLAGHPELRTSMGLAGRDRVARLYDWERNVEQMLRIYESTTTEFPAQRSRDMRRVGV